MFLDIITDPVRYIAPVFAKASQVSYRKSADLKIRTDGAKSVLNINHGQYSYKTTRSGSFLRFQTFMQYIRYFFVRR